MEGNRLLSEVSALTLGGSGNLSSGQLTGQWVKLVEYHRLRIIVLRLNATSGDDAEITVQQATDINGDGAAALDFTQYRTRIGAVATVGLQDTLVTQAVGNTCTPAFGGEPGAVVIEFQSDQLNDNPIEGGCQYVNVSVGATENSSECVILYEPYDARHPQATPSSVVV